MDGGSERNNHRGIRSGRRRAVHVTEEEVHSTHSKTSPALLALMRATESRLELSGAQD